MLDDESLLGSAHIGMGTSAMLGGTLFASSHIDFVLLHPILYIDDTCVLNGTTLLVNSAS